VTRPDQGYDVIRVYCKDEYASRCEIGAMPGALPREKKISGGAWWERGQGERG